MPLGRQSQPHLNLARKFLTQARTATKYTRTGCASAFPHLIEAVDNLSAAWEHLQSVSGAPPPRGKQKSVRARDQRIKQVRERKELQEQYTDTQRIIKRDLAVYLQRCTRE
jgi:hypothetical protein